MLQHTKRHPILIETGKDVFFCAFNTVAGMAVHATLVRQSKSELNIRFNTVAGMAVHATLLRGEFEVFPQFQYRCRYGRACNELLASAEFLGNKFQYRCRYGRACNFLGFISIIGILSMFQYRCRYGRACNTQDSTCTS